ncbi:TPA: hypothetical protein JBF73_02885 [Legionella pneumophila]|nr:hypothetical protein [Legionella pneumophila]
MPLFPEDKKDILIKQGGAGDCFLLASIDSLLCHPGGYNKLKSMFTENSDGSVTLRIKTTKQSARLTQDKMGEKYRYFHDPQTDEDVFIIDKKRLDDLEKDNLGVRTNCLAVKLLERISAYYYYDIPLVPGEPNYSVLAHEHRNVQEDPSTVFVANLFSLYTQDNLSLQQIMQLKKMMPDLPVYLSKKFSNEISGRHAYRVNEFKSVDGQQEVVLVNPWDNQKKEPHKVEKIKELMPRWCFYALDLATYHYSMWISDQHENTIHYLIQNPLVIQILQDGIHQFPHLGKDLLNRYIYLLQYNPQIITYYEALSSEQRDAIHNYLNAQKMYQSVADITNFIFTHPLFADLTAKIIQTTDRFPDEQLLKILKEVVEKGTIESYRLLKQKYQLPLRSLLESNPELYHDVVTLDLQSPPIDGKLWTEINRKAYPDAPSYFAKSFLEQVIEYAAHERKNSGLDSYSAVNYVKSSLIDYYFFHEDGALTRTGGLRDLFTSQFPLFSRAQILEVCSARDFNLKAISYFFRNISLKDEIYSQISEPLYLSAGECKRLLTADATTKDFYLQFKSIYSLSGHNPQAAYDLAQYALDNTQTIYSLSRSEVIARISGSKDTSFNKWLEQMQKKQVHPEQEVISEFNNIQHAIAKFTVDFMDENLEQIPARKEELLRQLGSLQCKDAQSRIETLQNLVVNKCLAEPAHKAYTAKVRQINQLAASRTLQAAIRKLKEIKLNLDHCLDERQLEQFSKIILNEINTIANHSEVLGAIKIKHTSSADLQMFQTVQGRIQRELRDVKEKQYAKIQSQKLQNNVVQEKQNRPLETAIINRQEEDYRVIKASMLVSDLLAFIKARPHLAKDLIFLELQSSPVNQSFILDLSKLFNPENKPHLGIEFLRQAIDVAAKEKQGKERMSFAQAKSYVLFSLISYPFGISNITRAGGLRDLFEGEAALFTAAQILELTTPEERDHYALSYFFTDFDLTQEVYQHVKNLKPLKIEGYQKLLEKAQSDKAVDHFKAMFHLSSHNQQIARDLARYALEQADTLYGQNIEGITAQIAAQNDPLLSKWFAENQIEKPRVNHVKNSALDFTQEENNFNSVINELNTINEQKSSRAVEELIESLNSLSKILFSIDIEKSQLLNSEIPLQLKKQIEQVHQFNDKRKDKILRQLERAIQAALTSLEKRIDKAHISASWLDLRKSISGGSLEQQQFAAAESDLERQLKNLPDGPLKKQVRGLKDEIGAAVEQVSSERNGSGLDAIAVRIEEKINNLPRDSRPSAWTSILDCLGRMINALISAVRALSKNNHASFFQASNQEKKLDALPQLIENKRDEPRDDCKVS